MKFSIAFIVPRFGWHAKSRWVDFFNDEAVSGKVKSTGGGRHLPKMFCTPLSKFHMCKFL